jgi:hypothetical protein
MLNTSITVLKLPHQRLPRVFLPLQQIPLRDKRLQLPASDNSHSFINRGTELCKLLRIASSRQFPPEFNLHLLLSNRVLAMLDQVGAAACNCNWY